LSKVELNRELAIVDKKEAVLAWVKDLKEGC
jgi:hypothetical protein